MAIKKLTSGGESETLEFKKSTSELKEGIISIAAILNKHQKGTLYFGIKNDGTVIGQEISEKTLRDISKSISDKIEPKIYPEISKVHIEGKSCLEVQFHGSSVPYYAFGRAYIRVSDADRQLSAKEIERLILKKNRDRIKWESEPSEFNISKVDESAVSDYVKRANIAGRIDFAFDTTDNILKKLNLVNNGILLKAAEVLFCNENTIEVQCAVFAGTDKVTFLDIKQFKGTIFSLLEKSEKYISEHINWRAEIGRLKREEIPEIPVKAIREALVNSFCHRDYYAPESNKIAIFKDRVEIWNPGTFPEGLIPEDFITGEGQSVLRNPLIAEILYKSKEIERWGSGLKRIYEECMTSNVKVEFKDLKTGFLVVFYRSEGITPKTTLKTTPKTTPKTRDEILHLIRQYPGITKEEIAGHLNITLDGVKYHIRKLTKEGIISWNGPSKGGRWEIEPDK
ncbi:MAG: putative DNA binding domain-containing protein [Candidatus Mariimomonas ferrooxydans]